MRYSMVIQWSDEDQVYVVSLPEWEAIGHIGHVHGKTYAEAVRQGEELIENLVEWAKQDGSPVPEPRIFSAA
ncbi:MAG: type II toxin-antitoxin system HicB family antitoxin [Ktedonobacterales bacterium]